MKTIANYIHFALVLAVGSSLFACGGANDNQDGALPEDLSVSPIKSSTVIAGVAMDGFIANGLVWLDIKDNDTLDGTEPMAYTDAQGYFSYNPISGVNYCDSDQAFLQQYCLQTGLNEGNVEVKVSKGLKVLTGVAFKNVLSAQIDLETAATNFNTLIQLGAKPEGDTHIWQQQVDNAMLALSPLGTLSHYYADDKSLLEALSVLGLSFTTDRSDAELLQMNYVEGVQLAVSGSRELLTANVMISALVDNFSGMYNASFENIDLGFDGLPISTADAVYKALAESISSVFSVQNGTESSTSNANYLTKMALASASTQSAVIDETVSLMQNLVDLQARSISELVSGQSNTNTVSLIQNLDTLQNNVVVKTTLINTIDFIRALPESPLINTGSSRQYINAFTVPSDTLNSIKFSAPRLATGVGENKLRANLAAGIAGLLTQNLAEDYNRVFLAPQGDNQNAEQLGNNIDIQALANAIPKNLENFSDMPSGSDFSLASIDSDNSILKSKKLSLSGVQDGGEQGQIVVFFADNNEADSANEKDYGSLILCIAYSNANDSSENIRAQRFEGSWNTIGAKQNRISLLAEGFSLQMNIAGETRGSDIPAEQEVASLQRNPNELYGKFRFTLNDDSATWHSDDASVNLSYGLQNTESVPNTSADCESVLSLRVQ